MKISEGIEVMHSKKSGKYENMNTVQFPFFRDGEVIDVKYRSGAKDFKLYKDAERIFYNIDSIKYSKEVIICEGEIDCLSFIEAGIMNVVSTPNGSTNGNVNLSYLDRHIDYFEGKEKIYLALDDDEPGRNVSKEFIRRLGAHRCYLVTQGWKDTLGVKDANEYLKKYGKERLAFSIQQAKEVPIEGIFSISDYSVDMDTLYENGFQKGYTIGHSNFDTLCSFELGRLCVVTGIPGHGKSEFVDEIAVLLNMRYDFKFAYFSPENYPATYLYAKLISKITGKTFDNKYLPKKEYDEVKEYINNNFYTIYPKADFTIEEIIKKAEYLVKKRGIKGLVVDPYNKLESRIPSGMNETNYISKQLDDLVTFAQKNNVLVFLVAHPRKMQIKDSKPESPSLYDINGSANFFNKTDFGFTVYRDRSQDSVSVIIHKVKFRHLGGCGTAVFQYNFHNGRYIPLNGSKILPQNFNHDNFLTLKRKTIDELSQQTFNFQLSKSPEDMEAEFIADVTKEGDMPF
jgi:twinkle protein